MSTAKQDYIFVNINEDGEEYGVHDSIAAAMAVNSEFPNDCVVVRRRYTTSQEMPMTVTLDYSEWVDIRVILDEAALTVENEDFIRHEQIQQYENKIASQNIDQLPS